MHKPLLRLDIKLWMLKIFRKLLLSWVLSKEQIYETVWKADPEHCGAAVENVVYSLRRKIGDGYIETVVGSGYRFWGGENHNYRNKQ